MSSASANTTDRATAILRELLDASVEWAKGGDSWTIHDKRVARMAAAQEAARAYLATAPGPGEAPRQIELNAKRYEWLRNASAIYRQDGLGIKVNEYRYDKWELIDGIALDAAIDGAIAKETL